VPDLLGLLEADLDCLAGDSPDPALAAEVTDPLRHFLTRSLKSFGIAATTC
jgi:hypothetical protein